MIKLQYFNGSEFIDCGEFTNGKREIHTIYN